MGNIIAGSLFFWMGVELVTKVQIGIRNQKNYIVIANKKTVNKSLMMNPLVLEFESC
jgi:hypothetical protein